MCSGGRRCMGLVGGASATPARRKSGTTLSRTGGTSAMRRHPPTPRAGTPPGRPERCRERREGLARPGSRSASLRRLLGMLLDGPRRRKHAHVRAMPSRSSQANHAHRTFPAASGGDVGPLRRRGPTADCRGRRGATTHGAAAGAAARSPGGGGGRRGAREGRRRLRAASARGGGRQLSARPSRRRGLCEAGEAGSPGSSGARLRSGEPSVTLGRETKTARSLSPSAHAIRPSARRPCRSAGGSASAGPTRSAASWPRCPC
ncbi:unnamed protein product [Prorocentrum cordatum]|uniref:Uncharacterized protein n=1 Tax=Prorocentrum cordatum TaxID=2364126 RepID=A0ABN9WZS6_9DINO|nr:unnamed protein product [Polarella glacialis]